MNLGSFGVSMSRRTCGGIEATMEIWNKANSWGSVLVVSILIIIWRRLSLIGSYQTFPR